MKNLQLIESKRFGLSTCDVYVYGDEFLVSRKQIGEALEYADPQKAIDKIHGRHKERLDKYSVTPKVGATDGKSYDTILYTPKGVYEICRWSHQPKADAFYDWVYDMLEGLRTGRLRLETVKLNRKPIRRSLTDEIKALPNSPHKGMRYKQFTDLVYKTVVGKTARQIRQEHSAPPKSIASDFFTVDELSAVTALEDCVASMIRVGMNYQQVKAALLNLKQIGNAA